MPCPLPLSHLTEARNFSNIADRGQLVPQPCRVFSEDLIYFFYGGIFYRTSSRPTNDADYLPVGFLFSPKVLDLIEKFYPVDTGLLHKFSSDPDFEDVREFRTLLSVLGGDRVVPCKMIHYIYENNERYLYGAAREHCKELPAPFPTLYSFISRDLTGRGIDQRWRRFEAHCVHPISLEDVIWIGYPDAFEEEFMVLCERLKARPRSFTYKSYPANVPSEWASVLQHQAQKTIGEYITGR